LDLLGREFEDDFDSPPSPISPNSNIPVHSLPLSPVSPNDSNIAALSSVEYPVMTWDTYKQDLSNFQPHVYYAKNLVSLLHDYINAQDDSFRMSPHMRQVFESAIVENTADDEPDAPLIRVENEVDDEPAPPWEFYYTNKLWLGEGIDPPDMTKLVGCDCKGKCDPKSKTCSCLRRQKEYLKGYYDDGFAYDNKGRLRTVGVPIFECNSLCGCDDDECKNRVRCDIFELRIFFSFKVFRLFSTGGNVMLLSKRRWTKVGVRHLSVFLGIGVSFSSHRGVCFETDSQGDLHWIILGRIHAR
jgi:histone-lysine N-methyltransferase SUV39H